MNEIERINELLRYINQRNTHTYWTILNYHKIDNPSEREIELESLAYTLPDIKYKDCEKFKKLVAKEFNQKIREKYKPRPGYRMSPIDIGNIYLKREEAEKRMEEIKKSEEAVSRQPKEGD